MAITGISTFETEDFISDTDTKKDENGVTVKQTEEDGATVFVLGSLDVDIKARIMDGAISIFQTPSQGARVATNNNITNLEAVRYGLRGWRNFKNKNNAPILFEQEKDFVNGKEYMVVTKQTLNSLPLALINEIGRKILTVNSVDAELAGKLKTE